MPLRLLHTPALDAATNMALDEALLARARRTGDVVVRAYTWAGPALSFGRHQTARGVYDADRAAAHGIAVVRRPTGGRAVLHARELTYSVTAPTDALGASLRAAYDRINRVLADALGALGVRAWGAAPAGRARRPDGAPCFDAPAAGELVVGEDARKLVGSAQWREGGALLQHGSILLDDDQGLLGACAAAPVAPYRPPATLAALLGRAVRADEVAGALFGAARRLAAELGGAVAPGCDLAALDDPELAAEVARLRPRYADPAWTWRR